MGRMSKNKGKDRGSVAAAPSRSKNVKAKASTKGAAARAMTSTRHGKKGTTSHSGATALVGVVACSADLSECLLLERESSLEFKEFMQGTVYAVDKSASTAQKAAGGPPKLPKALSFLERKFYFMTTDELEAVLAHSSSPTDWETFWQHHWKPLSSSLHSSKSSPISTADSASSSSCSSPPPLTTTTLAATTTEAEGEDGENEGGKSVPLPPLRKDLFEWLNKDAQQKIERLLAYRKQTQLAMTLGCTWDLPTYYVPKPSNSDAKWQAVLRGFSRDLGLAHSAPFLRRMGGGEVVTTSTGATFFLATCDAVVAADASGSCDTADGGGNGHDGNGNSELREEQTASSSPPLLSATAKYLPMDAALQFFETYVQALDHMTLHWEKSWKQHGLQLEEVDITRKREWASARLDVLQKTKTQRAIKNHSSVQ
ncbi:hypothetical protein QOT17_017532 [Balamuthia mandrillaris]